MESVDSVVIIAAVAALIAAGIGVGFWRVRKRPVLPREPPPPPSDEAPQTVEPTQPPEPDDRPTRPPGRSLNPRYPWYLQIRLKTCPLSVSFARWKFDPPFLLDPFILEPPPRAATGPAQFLVLCPPRPRTQKCLRS